MLDNLIYDVGVNNGDDTAYYLAKGFRVVGIDADAQLIRKVSRRFEREIADGRLIVLNIGVSDREGVLPFYICDSNPEWSTFNPAVAEDKSVNFYQVDVPCRRFRSIIDEFGVPYYLKLDIEGNEIFCIQDLDAVDLPAYLSFEKTARHSLDSLAALKKLGYTQFKLITQDRFLPVEYPPSPEQAKYERTRILIESQNIFSRIIRKTGGSPLRRLLEPKRFRLDWTFPMGSSGLFGEETGGRWQSFNDIVDTLERANALISAGKKSVLWGDQSYSFWADFHAKRPV